MHTSQLKVGQNVICEKEGVEFPGTIVKERYGNKLRVEYGQVKESLTPGQFYRSSVILKNYKIDNSVRGSEGGTSNGKRMVWEPAIYVRRIVE